GGGGRLRQRYAEMAEPVVVHRNIDVTAAVDDSELLDRAYGQLAGNVGSGASQAEDQGRAQKFFAAPFHRSQKLLLLAKNFKQPRRGNIRVSPRRIGRGRSRLVEGKKIIRMPVP